MVNLVRKSWRTGLVTTNYPAAAEPAPPTFRGRPLLDPVRCTGHAACAAACPSGCLQVGHQAGADGRVWSLDLAACLFCGLCAEVCPEGAITLGQDYELAAYERRDLLTRVSFAAGGRPGIALAPPPPPIGQVERDLKAAIRRRFRRSLHLRHLDVGSDNAADWELNALLGPNYDLQRLGIDVVASPRHADALVVTGAVAHNSRQSLLRTIAATPEPRLVIALGADACGGGLLGDGYATAGGVDRVVPVDVYIPGCPPRPLAILYGLLLAMGRLEQRVGLVEARVPTVGG